MSTWLSLALTGLKIVSMLLDWAKEKKQFSAGQDAEIAKASVAILNKTETGRRIMAEVQAMSEEEVDILLKKLESP